MFSQVLEWPNREVPEAKTEDVGSCAFLDPLKMLQALLPSAPFPLVHHLIESVFLAELHALLPAVIAFEEIGRDSPELNQLVFFQALGEGDVVKVVIGVYRCPKSLGEGGGEQKCGSGL